MTIHLRHKRIEYTDTLLSGREGTLVKCSCGYNPTKDRSTRSGVYFGYQGPIGTEFGYKKHVKAVWAKRFEAIKGLAIIAAYAFVVYQMATAIGDGNWAKGCFWAIAIIGVSLERKVNSIMETVEQIKVRQ